jgi:hypothetical protein
MSQPSPTIQDARLSLGEAFLEALGQRDFNSLYNLFQPNVRSRLMLPSGVMTPADAAGLAARFRDWFGAADPFEITGSEVSLIGDSLAVHYSLRLLEEGEWWVVQQKTYSKVVDGRIQFMDLLCSGQHPADMG